MISILQVLSEHNVADIEEGSEGRDRLVPHTPVVMKNIGNASIEDQAPEWVSRLIDRPERFNEKG
jgi:hypothetical protein